MRFPAMLILLIAAVASPSMAATISGTVFEDADYGGGAGRSFAAAAGTGLPNVRVELYTARGTDRKSVV